MRASRTHQIALFDIDGTLADYDGRMRRDLRTLQAPYEPAYRLHDRHAPRYFDSRRDLIKAQPGWWLSLPTLRLGFDLLRLAQSLGFQVQILTKGPHNTASAWAEKVQWCHRYIGPTVKVTVTEDKSLVYGKVLVDDTPEYIVDWLAEHPAGWGILPAQPANKGFTHPRAVRYDGTNLDAARAKMRAALKS